MQTDRDTTLGENSTKTVEHSDSAVRRTGRVVLALVNPFSDLVVIYRRGIAPTIERLGLLRKMVSGRFAPRESLSFEQAVACTGFSVEQLNRGFKRNRALWWLLMAVPGALSLCLMAMVLVSSELPAGTLLRVVLTILVLTALSMVGFGHALIATYRLWQLKARRVSEEEHGTFRDFLAENKWCRQVLSLGLAR